LLGFGLIDRIKEILVYPYDHIVLRSNNDLSQIDIHVAITIQGSLTHKKLSIRRDQNFTFIFHEGWKCSNVSSSLRVYVEYSIYTLWSVHSMCELVYWGQVVPLEHHTSLVYIHLLLVQVSVFDAHAHEWINFLKGSIYPWINFMDWCTIVFHYLWIRMNHSAKISGWFIWWISVILKACVEIES
jgi:hypothetical protein